MDVARPALRMKMQKYGGGDGENIRFNLLAIVEDQYSKFSDQLELLKREKIALERRLNEAYPEGWGDKVRRTSFTVTPIPTDHFRWIPHFTLLQRKSFLHLHRQRPP
jgi:hypothetical protein